MKKMNTLEVGAINIQLQQYSGLTVRAIDINSQVSLLSLCSLLDPTPPPPLLLSSNCNSILRLKSLTSLILCHRATLI